MPNSTADYKFVDGLPVELNLLTDKNYLDITDGKHLLRFVSSTDGNCFLNALLACCKPGDLSDAIAAFTLISNDGGINLERALTTGNHLGIPVFTIRNFYDTHYATNLSSLCSPTKIDLMPAILLDDTPRTHGHVYLVYPPRARDNRGNWRRLLASNVAQGLLAPIMNNPQTVQVKTVKQKKQSAVVRPYPLVKNPETLPDKRYCKNAPHVALWLFCMMNDLPARKIKVDCKLCHVIYSRLCPRRHL